MHVTATGALIGGTYVQDGAGAQTIVDGRFAAAQAYIQGGMFAGRGIVSGPVSFDNTIPGTSAPIVVRPGGLDADGKWGGALAFDAPPGFGSGSVIEIIIGGVGEHGRLVLGAGAYFDSGSPCSDLSRRAMDSDRPRQ